MNYYEKHLGDYAKQTGHLSLLEHGVYSRLLDIYYTFEEAPLAEKVTRLVGAKSKDERAALQLVLEEFFELHEDGRWHKGRCDEEIAAFQAAQPEREAEQQAKKENENERQRRHRERRRELFEKLRGFGIVPAYDAKTGDLVAMLTRAESRAGNEPVTSQPPSPVTAPVTPATATQTPDTNTQYPEIQRAQPDATTLRALAEGTAEPEEPGSGPGNRYGLAARAMRLKGCSANPGDPRLRQLVDQGASIEEFEAVAAECADKGKAAAWGLTALINRRKEAADIRLAPQPAAPPWYETADGVNARAQQLGMPTWFEHQAEQLRKGVAPNQGAYRASIIAADRAAGGSA